MHGSPHLLGVEVLPSLVVELFVEDSSINTRLGGGAEYELTTQPARDYTAFSGLACGRDGSVATHPEIDERVAKVAPVLIVDR